MSARVAPHTREQSNPLAAVRDWFRQWSYYQAAEATDRRDYRLDMLRGFCIFAMVVDHLGGDSWLYAITGGNRFYVSAAEGFIFISGFVMGQVYQRKIAKAGVLPSMRDVLRRGRTLYVSTVALTLIFSALYLYTDIQLWTGRDFGLGIENFDEIVVASLTLHYTYHGTDILAMYALLILASPITLLLLALGAWRWVVIPSVLWWLAFQIYPEQASLPWYIRHGENFPLGAWQVLFIVGQVLGYHRDRLTALARRWPHVTITSAALATAFMLGLISLFWTSESGVRLPGAFAAFDVDPSVLSEQFFKVALRPWRLVAFASVAIALYTLVTYAWRPLNWLTGWLLLPLGQSALYGYIVHFFLILVVLNLVPVLDAYEIPTETFTPMLQIGIVLLLWLMIRKEFLFRIVPR